MEGDGSNHIHVERMRADVLRFLTMLRDAREPFLIPTDLHYVIDSCEQKDFIYRNEYGRWSITPEGRELLDRSEAQVGDIPIPRGHV